VLENKKKELECILPEFVLGKYKGFTYQNNDYLYSGKIDFNSSITFYKFIAPIISNDFTVFCEDDTVKEIYKQRHSIELTDLDLKHADTVTYIIRKSIDEAIINSITANASL
jgi:hypothetical protein